jgi:hypothetical protein
MSVCCGLHVGNLHCGENIITGMKAKIIQWVEHIEGMGRAKIQKTIQSGRSG